MLSGPIPKYLVVFNYVKFENIVSLIWCTITLILRISTTIMSHFIQFSPFKNIIKKMEELLMVQEVGVTPGGISCEMTLFAAREDLLTFARPPPQMEKFQLWGEICGC